MRRVGGFHWLCPSKWMRRVGAPIGCARLIECDGSGLLSAVPGWVHCNENPIYVFSEKELQGLSLSTVMCLWAIYIFPRSVHIFSCSRIGRSIVEIFKSLTDTWMQKMGLRPSNSFSGNIFGIVSLQCEWEVLGCGRLLCEWQPNKLLWSHMHKIYIL